MHSLLLEELLLFQPAGGAPAVSGSAALALSARSNAVAAKASSGTGLAALSGRPIATGAKGGAGTAQAAALARQATAGAKSVPGSALLRTGLAPAAIGAKGGQGAAVDALAAALLAAGIKGAGATGAAFAALSARSLGAGRKDVTGAVYAALGLRPDGLGRKGTAGSGVMPILARVTAAGFSARFGGGIAIGMLLSRGAGIGGQPAAIATVVALAGDFRTSWALQGEFKITFTLSGSVSGMKRHQDVRSAKSGDTIRFDVTVKEGAAAKNLAGCSAAWRMATTYAGPALITKTTGVGIAITDASAGKITVTLDPADTADLKGDFVHELEIVDGAGAKATVFDGRLTLLEDLVA